MWEPYQALYLHIPFCKQRCRYCDFKTAACAVDNPKIDEYIENLVLQVRRAGREGELAAVRTVYVGGGTPSHIGLSRLSMLFYTLSLSMHLTPEVECTMEANPESLTPNMVRDLWALGVNRLSLGVQSFDDSVLQLLGRVHNAETARVAVRAAQERFENVSVDLMCGIPGQSMESFRASVREALALGVKHVSIYPLTIEEGTPFDQMLSAGELAEPDPDLQADMMEEAEAILTSVGMYRYEVASYAFPGYESRHNQAYWTGVPYLGLGAGAVGMRQNDEMRERWENGELVERLDKRQRIAEDLMLGMRMARGITVSQMRSADLGLPGVQAAFEALEREGLVAVGAERICPTHRGWLLGNHLYGRLLDLAP